MESLLISSGSGSGSGSGDGSGSGSGYGYGYDNGSGYGSGSGSGYGYGSGSGSGVFVGKIDKHDVHVNVNFGVVSIGCQLRTIEDWQSNWRDIASKNDVSINEKDALALLAKIREVESKWTT